MNRTFKKVMWNQAYNLRIHSLILKSPNEFGLKAAFKKPKVLGQSPKGSKLLKTHSSQAQKNPAQKDIFPPAI